VQRTISDSLERWLLDPGRRPLVLRGARQVGKTWLVRDLARRCGRDLIELNFERDPGQKRWFSGNDPRRILGELSLALNREITPDRSILFLDEIQAAGEVLGKLRWFYEELPELPVVAAGSLLEFTLADHTFSMPVGRITYRHIEPLSFPEFLGAHGQDRLRGVLTPWRVGGELSPAAHEAATDWFHRYSMVGGMPAVVAADAGGRDPGECREMQHELMATYRADFAKYSGRMDRDILDAVLNTVAASVGSKFVYARVGEGVKQHQARRGLELLAAARLCHLVRHSAANGIPLGAEASNKFRKAVLLDAGLLHGLLGTPAAGSFPSHDSLASTVRGRLADQMAAQQLRLRDTGPGDGPELYYWQREGNRSAEIDYVIQAHGHVVPVELKSGAAGAMKSLHQFMYGKHLGLAVRCDANPPGIMDVDLKTTCGDPVRYRMVSLPAYLLWNIDEILEGLLQQTEPAPGRQP
jgi:predicted AAA+ superfamily ATPase